MSSSSSAFGPKIDALGRFASRVRICTGERRTRCASVPSSEHRQASICAHSRKHSACSRISSAWRHRLDQTPRHDDPEAVGSNRDRCAPSGAVAPGGPSREIDERTNSPAGCSESFNTPAMTRPMRLGLISAAAAALLSDSGCGSLSAARVAGHSRRDAGVPRLFSDEFRLPAPGTVPVYATEPLRGWLMTIIVVLGLMALPLAMLWRWQPEERVFELTAASSHAMKNGPAQRSEPEPRLVGTMIRASLSGEPVPLGLTLHGRAAGGFVVIAG